MNIKEVITIINQMEVDGAIERYAIGGAVGATFYLEPVATLDVDIFAGIKPVPGSLLVSLQSIFDYLKAKGGTVEGEYIIIGGWPVQFLTPGTPLAEEALRESVIQDVDGTPARVFTAEHLAAIALQTGRAKDKARLLQFVEAAVLNPVRFKDILTRHSLLDAWRRFERQFPGDVP
ncbi:MAG TPA: hypothetical protein VH595_20690 [Verrucomicrobiae bacterium]|nr:hypothetical protein [Verrucomicrobiae bacterium]